MNAVLYWNWNQYKPVYIYWWFMQNTEANHWNLQDIKLLYIYDDKMMHKAWWCLGEVPYYFSRSSIKFQGHTALKIVNFDPYWAFPDCNSSFNSPMATKWCKKLEVA